MCALPVSSQVEAGLWSEGESRARRSRLSSPLSSSAESSRPHLLSLVPPTAHETRPPCSALPDAQPGPPSPHPHPGAPSPQSTARPPASRPRPSSPTSPHTQPSSPTRSQVRTHSLLALLLCARAQADRLPPPSRRPRFSPSVASCRPVSRPARSRPRRRSVLSSRRVARARPDHLIAPAPQTTPSPRVRRPPAGSDPPRPHAHARRRPPLPARRQLPRRCRRQPAPRRLRADRQVRLVLSNVLEPRHPASTDLPLRLLARSIAIGYNHPTLIELAKTVRRLGLVQRAGC